MNLEYSGSSTLLFSLTCILCSCIELINTRKLSISTHNEKRERGIYLSSTSACHLEFFPQGIVVAANLPSNEDKCRDCCKG